MPSNHLRITVIGAGVIGLSCAHELADTGHEVTVIADHGPGDTVSALAGALWFPYHAAGTEQVVERSLRRFVELAALGDTSADTATDDFTDDVPPVQMRTGVLHERLDPPDRSWVAPVVNVLGEDAVQPVDGGVRATLPMIMTSRYLAWLMDSCRMNGVAFQWRTVASLEELTGTRDAVVIAGGLRGGELLGGDDAVTPVRGQLMLFANGDGGEDGPLLTDWVVDSDDPSHMTYVFPREDEIVVGGTSESGSWDETPDQATAEAILSRAEALVPELTELPIIGHGAGLRPARETVRIEHVDGYDLPVIAAYGHGGAGVTLSWGTAERVVELVGEL
ncbi:FAD-dependent oxidoreductase [Corynebacterium glyciniphilum]|uniref:FAD-dependent oxidoreductase n=1 Tax=Corynebacterium glyciniphilum TaxID=1404244 RepID=UPI0021B454BC|nr:FAD-dependent oxidoreductase [Corynebacterium glyciniphilum]